VICPISELRRPQAGRAPHGFREPGTIVTSILDPLTSNAQGWSETIAPSYLGGRGISGDWINSPNCWIVAGQKVMNFRK
jgi:hypothetical protein